MLKTISHKIKLLFAAVAIAGVSAGTAVAVGAVIPDTNGVINGCYHNRAGNLRIVENTSECRPSETAINWNQTGSQGPPGTGGGDVGVQIAHASFNPDGTLNAEFSKNIKAAKIVETTLSNGNTITNGCFKVAFSPKSGMYGGKLDDPSPYSTTFTVPILRLQPNTSNGATIDADCGPEYNAEAVNVRSFDTGNIQPFIYTFFN